MGCAGIAVDTEGCTACQDASSGAGLLRISTVGADTDQVATTGVAATLVDARPRKNCSTAHALCQLQNAFSVPVHGEVAAAGIDRVGELDVGNDGIAGVVG